MSDYQDLSPTLPSTTGATPASQERVVNPTNGWPVLLIVIALYALVSYLFYLGFTINSGDTSTVIDPETGLASVESMPSVWLLLAAAAVLIVAVIIPVGFYTLQPNEARVLILFGSYRGTVRNSGFAWGNPFYANGSPGHATVTTTTTKGGAAPTEVESSATLKRYKVSLRARTLNGERLKVNDMRGNPIDIGAVVVWHVQDTAKAVFDVDDVERYVALQSETSVRHLATTYPYDTGETDANEPDEITLRGNVDEVSEALRKELGERLAPAGVVVDQARLTHLAYSPEIAQTMLRRQQAEAVIAARRKIVTGAVSMVEMALNDLRERDLLDLDPERKAAMVSNLLVVLCSESAAQPILNAGASTH
jgi:regulator of protease activity HflC (stomatin/prohibitin superfamily)